MRWNNFNDGAKTYQGELVGKDRFKNAFLGQQTRVDGYDYSKLEAVLNTLVSNCVAISEVANSANLENG